MTTIELTTKKAELVKSIIINANTEDIINELSQVLKKAISKEIPCQYTDEEVREALIETIKESKAGTGTPHEELKRKSL